jgi:hypothetical protein
MAIPQPRDPFGGWRQWQEENPDSLLSRVPLPRPGEPRAETVPFSPYSAGAPGIPQAVRRGLGEVRDTVGDWMNQGRMIPPAMAGMATDPTVSEGSRGQAFQDTMTGLGEDVREVAGLNPNLVEEWRRRRLEPPPNLPPPPGSTAHPPEMAPDLPVQPYPDVGPTWDLRRETAQQYPMTDDSRQMLFDTGISWYPYAHDPHTMGTTRGRYYPPDAPNRPEPYVDVLGKLDGTAPSTLIHELAHKWWYEKMTSAEQAAWARDWRDHTDLAVQGNLATQYAGAELSWPTEALSFTLQKSAENVPPQVVETYAAGFYDAQKLAEQAEANLERQRIAEMSEAMAPQTLYEAYTDYGEAMFDHYFGPVSDPADIRRRIWQRGIGGWRPGASG